MALFYKGKTLCALLTIYFAVIGFDVGETVLDPNFIGSGRGNHHEESEFNVAKPDELPDMKVINEHHVMTLPHSGVESTTLAKDAWEITTEGIFTSTTEITTESTTESATESTTTTPTTTTTTTTSTTTITTTTTTPTTTTTTTTPTTTTTTTTPTTTTTTPTTTTTTELPTKTTEEEITTTVDEISLMEWHGKSSTVEEKPKASAMSKFKTKATKKMHENEFTTESVDTASSAANDSALPDAVTGSNVTSGNATVGSISETIKNSSTSQIVMIGGISGFGGLALVSLVLILLIHFKVIFVKTAGGDEEGAEPIGKQNWAKHDAKNNRSAYF